ncbi:potassium transporter TrkH [Skermanella aerolata KACC 11604]|nr:potassium transporter TrkH [Skermanella aerolata KACC 11604]
MTSPEMVRPVFHIIGILLAVLGVGMLVPALLDSAIGHSDWIVFVTSSAITIGAAGALYLGTSGPIERFGVKQTFLLTTMAWVVLAVFGALPFMMSTTQLDFTDAFYEAMSGLSTTGGTVIVGLDNAPPGVLLWRALLNWFGGIGIIVMAIAILPVLRVGGMQLFRTESSDRGDKPFATVRDTANGITLTYLGLTVFSTVLFNLAGMDWFDAVCHAMAAVSTGGFSTKDASLGYFESIPILWVAVVSMISGAVPLTYYIRLLRNFGGAALADSQVWTLMGILVVSVGAMTGWAYFEVGLEFVPALSHSAVNVVSIITDTGFVSTDYSTWGGFPMVTFFFFFFIGGCTGSTSGSIKIFRWQILFGSMQAQMIRMLQPHRVVVRTYNGKPVQPDVVDGVINFVFAYILSYVILTLMIAATGLDMLTASSSVASALAGAGPGLGPVVGPAGTFAPLPDAAKWVLCLAMLLGRLEVFTVIVLFTRTFWRS